MRFPDQLTVVASDRRTGAPVANVALLLRLFAARKNDYGVGPLISDEKGEAVFARVECEFAIRRSKEMFLMDYHDNLEDCRPFIEINLHPAELVERMIQQYRDAPTFWGPGFRDPERLFAALQGVKNVEYESASIKLSEEQVLSNPRIELLLTKVHEAPGS
jgi:hypothetical protein